jgi:uncharacterized protein (TIRG00374 family)
MPTHDRSPPEPPRQRLQRWGWVVFTYALAAACLFWVFHDVSPSELLRSLAGVNWWWVLPAIVLDLLVYVCAAWEWQWLLRPVGRLSLRRSTQALFAGRFANDVLPLHAGYLIRLYVASRWLGASVARIIPSLLIERLFDAFWLALGIGFATLFFPVPGEFTRAGEVLGGAIVAGVVVVAWVIFHKRSASTEAPPSGWFRWKPLRRLASFLERLTQGVRSIGRSNLILAALGLSIVKLLLQALAFLSLLSAYRFSFSLWIQLAIFLFAYVGISMPSTPASLGVFQLCCAAGLRFFGVPRPAASGFALLAYVVLTAPLSIAGFIAITRTGLTWRQVRTEALHWKRQMTGA